MNCTLVPMRRKEIKCLRYQPVSPSPYSAMESVSLSGAALGSLLIDPRPWDLLSSLKQSQLKIHTYKCN